MLRFLVLNVNVTYVGLMYDNVYVFIGGVNVVGLDGYSESTFLPPASLWMIEALLRVKI